MLVEEIMSRDIVSIDCNKTVYDACKVYSQNKVGSLVVMDKNITVGIVTERDTIERVILENRNPKTTKVRDIMSKNLITIYALAPIEKAAKIMKENGIKKLPVIMNNEIVGILTETDLSRTIDAFSEAIGNLFEFYGDSRETIEKIMDDWGNLLISLKSYKSLSQNKQIEPIKGEV